jgi:hypothetical protein
MLTRNSITEEEEHGPVREVTIGQYRLRLVVPESAEYAREGFSY